MTIQEIALDTIIVSMTVVFACIGIAAIVSVVYMIKEMFFKPETRRK